MNADVIGIGGLLALIALILGILVMVGAVAMSAVVVGGCIVLLAVAVLSTRIWRSRL